uniref:Uncharacterized protein n=1 Tax=Toxoplasma gondii COUG TaxID=1074873 RepID=A0A2G8YD14_TOXGO|nr:hypothetical protein TGCOUG_391290 [Toxoplasma gondii COUG]
MWKGREAHVEDVSPIFLESLRCNGGEALRQNSFDFSSFFARKQRISGNLAAREVPWMSPKGGEKEKLPRREGNARCCLCFWSRNACMHPCRMHAFFRWIQGRNHLSSRPDLLRSLSFPVCLSSLPRRLLPPFLPFFNSSSAAPGSPAGR